MATAKELFRCGPDEESSWLYIFYDDGTFAMVNPDPTTIQLKWKWDAERLSLMWNDITPAYYEHGWHKLNSPAANQAYESHVGNLVVHP